LNGWCPGETMSKQVLYIDGDSWLTAPGIIHFLDSNYKLFDDFLVINASVYANSNYDIINRTIRNVQALKELNIKPWVLVGLSEVGRGLHEECKWQLPDKAQDVDLNDYLRSLLEFEVNILNTQLGDCPRYICSAWTTGVTGNKNFIDFIDPANASSYPQAYIIWPDRIKWYVSRRKLFRLTKDSIATAIENSSQYRDRCLNTGVVDETMHLKDYNSVRLGWEPYATTEIYKDFFTHALTTMRNQGNTGEVLSST